MAFPKWSVIVNRMDKLGQKFWTEWRANLVETGPAQEGDIPMIGPSGVIDPSLLPGSSTNPIVTTLTAAEIINAFQVVSVRADGLAHKADSGNVADASGTVGIAITSATVPGNTLQVQQVGFLSNLGWNWPTPGVTLYVGTGGVLTTSPNTGVFELPIGTTISNTEVEVQIGLPIILA